jgi:FtsP/CotA-like multicopper oxidase with cupredoxin domain
MRLLPLITFLVFIFNAPFAYAKTVEYTFDVNYKTVNFTGEAVKAMAIGGSIPAPTIEAAVGDTLRVTFNNKMDVETSVHWHGILLPNDQDGVPYLTTPPIKAGSSFTYEFPVIHHGTYWYHSHTGLQEQRGVYGALIFHPKNGEKVKAGHDVVVVLSDWTDENPNKVMHNLKKSDDYYALKKDNVQSWLKVIQHGPQAIKNRINSAWIRMGSMDISDVGYDAFLANGKHQERIDNVKAGDKIRLRIVNAAASSYFNFEYAGGPMTIVSADGVDVVPFKVKRQRIAIAETFDVIIELPDNKSYELRATSEDGTGYSAVIIGDGPLVRAPDIIPPNPFLMDHSMHHKKAHKIDHSMMDHSAMEHDMGMIDYSMMDHSAMRHDMGMIEENPENMVEYELLKATEPTNYNHNNPKRTVRLELTGDMERFAWSFNNRVLSEDSKILIKKGETVQFVLANETMMHHPIHLHGHFFRVLNGQGKYSPLKHTVSVTAMQTVTIEFLANEEKDWLFHCHNLYHMKAGMTRVISYKDTTASNPNSLKPLFSDRKWYYFADFGFQTNFTNGDLIAENTRNTFHIDYEWDYDDDYELEIIYKRYINRFLQLYAGWEFDQEKKNDGERERDNTAIAGAHYLLPLMIEADLRIDGEGHGRVGLGSEMQLTDRASFEWEVNTDREYHLTLEYELNKQIAITGGRDDHFDWGIGMEIKF